MIGKFDQGVMHALKAIEFFKPKKRMIPLYKKQQPIHPGYVDFIAAFICIKPHSLSDWDSNRPSILEPHSEPTWDADLSSVLNRVVEAILMEDGLVSDLRLRKQMIRCLFRNLAEMKHWKQQPNWFHTVLFPREKTLWDAQSFEFDLFLAKVLLGRAAPLYSRDEQIINETRRSLIFGTVLEASIKSGQTRVIEFYLHNGVDVIDPSQRTLQIATECTNPEMLKLLLRPDLHLERPAFLAGQIQDAIQIATANDRTEAALSLIRYCHDYSDLTLRSCAADVFWTACQHSNFDIVTCLVDELNAVDVKHIASVYAPSLVQRVIFFGHLDMLRYLLRLFAHANEHCGGDQKKPLDDDKGKPCERVEPYDHEAVLIALACSGRISMAEYLLRDCEVQIDPWTWCNILSTAIHHGTERHFEFVEALIENKENRFLKNQRCYTTVGSLFQFAIEESSKSEVMYSELFLHACFYGNKTVVDKLIHYGADRDHLPGEAYANMPPVLAAKAAGQSTIVKLLLDNGAMDMDPMQSYLKERFGSGELPKAWEKRAFTVDTCWKWYA
jgi:hypothetical protein